MYSGAKLPKANATSMWESTDHPLMTHTGSAAPAYFDLSRSGMSPAAPDVAAMPGLAVLDA